MTAAEFINLQYYRREYGTLHHASHIIQYILLSLTDVLSTM
jgi:hypothetical protein